MSALPKAVSRATPRGGSKGKDCHLEEESGMKNRIKQRANRKLKIREEALDKRNFCGLKDLTAYNAVQQIRTKGKAEITLR